ncbi:cbb3-type cytochrome c oxidase subunit I [Fundidesulfovibrio soli]|uniref:cbb3-type cytochrome c oxidase subunit I n=1 Tax=Fundidesulfovibrio soli TaxID=2922716 RepID=UPI001FAF2331|nr:cbb3-type cytochrome c oxidase subunit I [Fundidesulfovibrio soli]
MTALYDKNQRATLAFLLAGAVWFVVGTLYGLASAIDLVAPETFNNIPWLVFGRARAVHTNTVIFGFSANILIGCGLYYAHTLLKPRQWPVKLVWGAFILWNLAVLSGPFTFSFGISQGREYAEYIWLADVSIMLSMLLITAILAVAVRSREEETLYVSVWYFVGTFLWMLGVYSIGNVMWRPETGAMPGMVDSVLLWFYGHNLVGLLVTPLAVGLAYYVIPRVTQTKLYSYTLSQIGFWTLVLFYTHIGSHHILQTPIPNWLKVASVAHSGAMAIPVLTVLVNLWVTARGAGGRLLRDPAGRLVLAGTIWYLVTSVQGVVQSFPSVQRVTHLGNFNIGHAHIAVLGFGGYIALGGLWHILPYVARRRLWSRRLVNLQFGLVTLGLTGFLAVLTIAGLIQGQAWQNGEVVYRVLPEIFPYMALRAAFGLSIIAGAIIGLVNVWMTLRRGEPFDPAVEPRGLLP